MLISVCGSQSPISAAIRSLVAVVTHATIGAATHVDAVDVAQLRDAWKNFSAEQRKSILLYSEAPEENLVDILTESSVHSIITFDSFQDVVAFQVVNTGKDLSAAMRAASISIAQPAGLLRSDRKLVFYTEVYNRDILDICDELTSFLDIKPSAEQYATLRAMLMGGRESLLFSEFISSRFRDWKPTDGYISSLSAEAKNCVQYIAQGYDALARGMSVPFHWPRLCFYDGELPGSPLLGSQLLVGPARCLFYGPDFHVPVGAWNCEMHIEVRDCQLDTLVILQVFNGDLLNAVSMRLPARGAYSIDMSFHVRYSHKPVEFRFQTLKGAIEGEFLLRDVVLSRENVRGSSYAS